MMTPQRNKRRERSSSEQETQSPSPKHDPNIPSSSLASSPFVYPPGLRFVPTDEELLFHYLKPFSPGNINSWPNLPIHHVNIYESNPQQLSEEYEKGNLKEWFFISERTKINKDGKKQKRGDNGGYWHATAGAKKINAGQGLVGYKTALTYYVGKQPNGEKTNWLMQEYWLESSRDDKTVDYALCKVYLSPKAKNKKKEEGVEALEQEVEQPRTVENQRPQPQLCRIQVAAAVENQPLVLLPPGFRFVPKDEELILYYLKPFLHGYPLLNIDIHHVNIYRYNPKQLAAEFKKGNDRDEWFFMTERRKKYDGGKRPDCSANGGYWKATGSETKVHAGKGVLGSKRSLVFHLGKQPKGLKTDWIMQEYRLDHPLPPSSPTHGDNKMLDTALCKIYETPMGKKKKAEEKQEEEEEEDAHLPRPSPFDELSRIFYPRQQETSTTFGDSFSHNFFGRKRIFLLN